MAEASGIKAKEFGLLWTIYDRPADFTTIFSPICPPDPIRLNAGLDILQQRVKSVLCQHVLAGK